MRVIAVIGTGNIGSRHLQALKLVKDDLKIFAVDNSLAALKTAKERYEGQQTKNKHVVVYSNNLLDLPAKVDIAIIATSSNVRAKIIQNLLKTCDVRFMILEKLLFNKKSDYSKIQRLTKLRKVKVWVNCSMRTQPFYKDLRHYFKNNRIAYFVTGGNFGLVTNAIHFVDHMVYLTGEEGFDIDTSLLEKKTIKSKRKGFLELGGNMLVKFRGGSFANIYSNLEKNASSPIAIDIHSENLRVISIDSQKTAFVSFRGNNWKWTQIKTQVPYQSEMTNLVVQKLLETGKCDLTTLEISSKIHLKLLEALMKHLDKNAKKKMMYYPFT